MKKSRFYYFIAILLTALAVPSVTTAQAMITGGTNEGGYAGDTKGVVTTDEKDVPLKWPLDKGAGNATSAEVAKEGLFSVAEYSYGSNLTIKETRVAGTVTETLFEPVAGGNTLQNDENAIVFTIKPKKGLTFTPKSLSFNASKVGTNGGAFDVVAFSGGKSFTLAENICPALIKNEPYYTPCRYDLSGVEPTGDVMTIKIYLKNLAVKKQYGFAEIVVTGDVKGTVEAVPVYTFTVNSGTQGAGSIICNPSGTEFDEGTLITLTATENFGYHFAGWTDGNGNIVSTENPYSFEIKENTSLTATYTQKDVYALNVTLEGGANANLMQFQPEGNVINGVHWYEAGTEVKLAAINNRILTFVNWEDNSTDAERTVTVDGEKNLTANFSCADYIVGWDLYNDQPSKDRQADYKADSENAGMLSLRKSDGTTGSWLTRGVGNGQENGKYAARIWKYLSEEWYFEISFSTKGYSNIVLSSCLGDDYNTYSVINVEYSIDGGTTFTKFGEFNPPARGWDGPKEFPLPEDAAGKERVYIRWMPDRTSEKIGVASDYDGTSIAEIFVLADAGALADEEALLVSSNPVDNGTGVSANGAVILNFDKKIKAGEGKATLNGEEIEPVVSGKSAIFKYSGLKYASDYTFIMPEGVLVSRSGKKVAAAKISFTTMERKQPAAKVYDAIVAVDGTGDYTTVQAAVDAAPEGRGTPWLIFIKNGEYKEHVDIPKTKPYLNLIGQNRDKVVIKDDRLSGGDNAVHVSVGATVVVNADNIFFENLTMENIYGHEKQAGPQALALNTCGDRIALNNVALLSYQDTWITTSTSNNRHYIKNSLIEGAVDFIYNSGNVYLDGDTLEINRPSGGYIVAPSHAADVKWGYVFKNNVIRPHAGVDVKDVWLGRPWHNQPKTVFINTQTYIDIPAKGWYNTMGGLPVLWADYNTVDADGNPVDLSQREDTYFYTDTNGDKVYGTAKNYLTDEEAASYTVRNVMGGDDGWQPDLLCEPVEAPVPVLSHGTITWDAVPYAICYVVTCGGNVMEITTATSYTIPVNDNAGAYSVQAVNEQGGLSKIAEAKASTAVTEINGSAAGVVSETVYTAGGKCIGTLRPGLNIVRRIMSDGSVKTVKVLK